ncbi:hypothetical protein KGM_213993 [Danaus plexippus plexippus]|uniref:Uncharacterized protein n=1 Tax=Danaus plexippus plexippus TaxID=278856 RepID=A0A212F2K5_DANPL|nr:hypothetical protein KGM_213993 [Danaus plexippus plexippus]
MFDVQSVGVKLCLEVQLFKAQRPWSRSPAQASPPQGSGRARIDRSESGRWRRARRRPRRAARAAAARLPPRGVYATVVTDITLSVNAQAAGARLNGHVQLVSVGARLPARRPAVLPVLVLRLPARRQAVLPVLVLLLFVFLGQVVSSFGGQVRDAEHLIRTGRACRF